MKNLLEPQRDLVAKNIPQKGVPSETKFLNRSMVAQLLFQNPGVWYLLGKVPELNQATTIAYQIRNAGAGWSQFGPGYEAECCTLHGEHRIYARWAYARWPEPQEDKK